MYVLVCAQDYPSVGQIVNMVREENVAVIFAVTPEVNETYLELVNLINQKFRATVTSIDISGDADNILGIIEQEYSVSDSRQDYRIFML